MKDQLAEYEAAVQSGQGRAGNRPQGDPEHDPPGRPGRGHATPTTPSSHTSGDKPTFDFKPKDHVDLVTVLDLADLEAGTKVAGQKFYFLKNEGALLELALVQYAISTLVAEGLHPGHHAGPGPDRGDGRDRVHAAEPGPDASASSTPSPTATSA